jgi:hypothetical protein
LVVWFSHASTQDLQVSNGIVVTSRHVPPLVSQWAYWRHLSPSRYSMVQTSGAFAPQARSRPWQVVIPQFFVSGELGLGVGTGVTVKFPPGEFEMQPMINAASTSKVQAAVRTKGIFIKSRSFPCKKLCYGIFIDLFDREKN